MSRRDSVTALALFLVALCYFAQTATRTFDPRDEGYLLGRSVEVAAGAVPHRDFTDVYGPGVFALTGAALRVGGGEVLALRILLMLFKALAVVAGYAVARQLVPGGAALFSAFLAIAYWGRFSSNLNTPYAALFTIPLCLLALWLLMRALERRSARSFLVAGGVAGLAILFKQSLAAMLVYGMLLAIWGVEMIEPARERKPYGRALTLLAWLAAGLLVLLPVSSYLNARDYLLHFLPAHVLVLGVAVQAWRVGGPPALRTTFARGLLPFAVAAAAPVAGVVLLYSVWGGLGPLVHDMFTLPMSLQSYYVAAALPPLSLVVAVIGAVSVGTGILLWLGDARRSAGVAALLGVVALATGRFAIPSAFPRLYDAEVLAWRGPFALEAVLAPGMLLAAIALVARRLARTREGRARTLAALPLLFFSGMLCFEVFPRAGHNLWILHGALAPLLALVLHGAYSLSAPEQTAPGGRLRRALAVLLVALLPLWLVAPIVRPVLLPAERSAERRPLLLPRARGLALSPQQLENEHLRDLEQLVAFLAVAEPRDAPLLLLTNDAVIPVLADRPLLFEQESYAFFLAGWGMLPDSDGARLNSPEMLEHLRATPGVLVVHRADATAVNLGRAVPRIRRFVERNFRVVAHFGVYRVLRRPG